MKVTERLVFEFKMCCKKFLIIMVQKLIDKSPICSPLVCFRPNVIRKTSSQLVKSRQSFCVIYPQAGGDEVAYVLNWL